MFDPQYMDQYFSQLDQISYILLVGCSISLLVQLYFILIVQGSLAFHKTRSAESLKNDPNIHPLPLSVIITVRNNEDQLKGNLPAILEQDYPAFEVVVVNDRSEDDTKWVLREMEAAYPNLRVVEIAEHVLSQQGKKFGVAMGIKAATHEHLVFTEVDCIPATNQWLRHLSTGFAGGKEIVLGYVPLKRKRGIRNALIRFEHFYRSINFLAFSLNGNPFMGLGQNMAYTKELFFRGKGFASHIHVSSGYDDLMVNQHATRDNTSIATHKEAHVWKPMPNSVEDYQNQRKLQRQAVGLYRKKHRFQLKLQSASAFLFYMALLALLAYNLESWPLVLGLYLFRLILQYAVYIPIAGKLRITRTLWFLPVMDAIHSFRIWK